MSVSSPATVVVLSVTALTSLLAFRDPTLRERWMLKPREVLAEKQFYRLLTSGLIHADWMHLAFNAYSFYSFAQVVEWLHGWQTLLTVYLSGILGGSLLSVFLHRNEDYRALGASGGVCGVIFASVFLLPGGRIMMFLVPVSIPAYLYALAFPVVSFIAFRRKADNVGHDAHLGGAIIGLLAAVALHPHIVEASPILFAVVLGISLSILCLLIFDPLQLLERRVFQSERPKGDERYQRYDEAKERNRKMAEIDRLLEKVSRGGIHNLSSSERKRLEQLSREVGGR